MGNGEWGMEDKMSGPLYSPQHYTMKPTRFTQLMRVFLPWQLIRFVMINIRMTVMVLKSHDTRVGRKEP